MERRHEQRPQKRGELVRNVWQMELPNNRNTGPLPELDLLISFRPLRPRVFDPLVLKFHSDSGVEIDELQVAIIGVSEISGFLGTKRIRPACSSSLKCFFL